ncbi:hypothetical protein FH972_006323 [Carpinus fangiana]|uniref:c-Myc-binding protein n=1 Tax=Carpinus fangiana TaxID=176857 RepID=A0A5N6QTS9_9ROSI|nr:hypothetical protein FH972_006323 [Carpinus fangiana]
MMRYKEKEEKEAKKEAFRKYLESSGVLDALTKVLVALYEQNDKPSSALEFIQQKLGGPSASEYEKLQAEMSNLQIKYDELVAEHQETCKEDPKLLNLFSARSVTLQCVGRPNRTQSTVRRPSNSTSFPSPRSAPSIGSSPPPSQTHQSWRNIRTHMPRQWHPQRRALMGRLTRMGSEGVVEEVLHCYAELNKQKERQISKMCVVYANRKRQAG